MTLMLLFISCVLKSIESDPSHTHTDRWTEHCSCSTCRPTAHRRLSDSPGAGGSGQKDSSSGPSSRSGSRSAPTAEVDPQTILKALFKSSSQSGSSGAGGSETVTGAHATAFRIKI